jgi:hypothetical protein
MTQINNYIFGIRNLLTFYWELYPAIRYILAKKRGIPLLSGLKNKKIPVSQQGFHLFKI